MTTGGRRFLLFLQEQENDRNDRRFDRDDKVSAADVMTDKNRKGREDKLKYDKEKRRDNDNGDFVKGKGKNKGKKKDQPKQPVLEKPKQKVEEPKEEIKVITIPESLTIGELASKMKIQASTLIKKLFMEGKIVTLNTEIDFETAENIAIDYEIIAEKEEVVDVIEELLKEDEEDPNTMVIGEDAWRVLKRNHQLKGLISNNQNKLVTLELLKEFFEIENIVIGKSIFADANGNFTRIWRDNIVLAYVPKLGASRTEYDPSYGYTVRKKDALNVDEYNKEGNKVKYIRATDIYTPFLVGAEAGYLITGVNDPSYDPKQDTLPKEDEENNG